MLEGLNILSASTVVVTGMGWTTAGIIFAVIAAIGVLLILAAFIAIDYDIATYLGMIGSIMLIGGILISLTACLDGKVIKEYETYKVTIDDSVSINEFNERYKILSQDGMIYEIVERANIEE